MQSLFFALTLDPGFRVLAPPASLSSSRLFVANLERIRTTGTHASVQCFLCSARLVALHFDKAKAFTLAGKNVMRQVDGAHGSERREHVGQSGFRCLGG